jgi:NNP family nitrate/nitrite transporter-like MFS transporter
VFVAMMRGVGGVLYFISHQGSARRFWGFFACFMAAVLRTGVGNASTFQMIPAIMRKEVERLMPGLTPRSAPSRREGIGGDHRLHLGDRGLWRLLHPEGYGTSIALTGGAGGALGFLASTSAACHHLGRLHPPGGLLHDVERGAARRAAPAPPITRRRRT